MKKFKIFGLLSFIIVVTIVLVACDSGGGVDTTRLAQEANNTLDEFERAMENSSISGLENTLSPDFVYTNGHRSNKDEFLDIMSVLFSYGGTYTKAQLNNRVNEVVSSTKVKISGSFRGEGYDVDGFYFEIIHPAQFTVERERGQWKITEWIDE